MDKVNTVFADMVDKEQSSLPEKRPQSKLQQSRECGKTELFKQRQPPRCGKRATMTTATAVASMSQAAIRRSQRVQSTLSTMTLCCTQEGVAGGRIGPISQHLKSASRLHKRRWDDLRTICWASLKQDSDHVVDSPVVFTGLSYPPVPTLVEYPPVSSQVLPFPFKMNSGIIVEYIYFTNPLRVNLFARRLL